jgi:hypothetical protein
MHMDKSNCFHMAWRMLTPKNFEQPDLDRWLFWAGSDIPLFYYFDL